MRILRTPLDVPLGLFVVSALVGVWASYDPAASWIKFAMIVAAVALYYAIVALRAAPQLLEAFVWLFVFASAALAVYFVTQHDYAADPGKFGPITALGLLLNRMIPQLGLHVFHPNVVAGELEIALPVGVGMLAARQQTTDNRRQTTEGGSRPANDAPLEIAGSFTGSPPPPLREVGRERLEGSVGSSAVGADASRSTGHWSVPTLALSIATGIVAFGLVMTESRGAWLALGVVGAAALALAYARDAVRRYALPLGAIGVLVAGISVLHLRDAFLPALDLVVGAIPAGNSAVSRVELWTQAWGLIRDYIFTGAGLGVFPMILSTYALGLDVPFLTHAHNLLLQIWLEQGLVGAAAFVWLVVAFYVWAVASPAGPRWETRGRERGVIDRQSLVAGQQSPAISLHPSSSQMSRGPATFILHPLFTGALAATTVMLLHGMVDVLLYSSRGLPVMFVPMGLAIAAKVTDDRRQTTDNRQETADSRQQGAQGRARKVWVAAYGLVLAGFLVLVAAYWRPVAAAWYANLGAVAQTRVELSRYHFPDALVGNIRRTADLSQAEAYFREALALDPGNVTARRRLSEIPLAGGTYDVGKGHALIAFVRDTANEVMW